MKKLKETPDLVINKVRYKAELIPPALIVARYFNDEQTTLDKLQAELDNSSQELESFIEEHASDSEDALLSEALNDKDRVTKASVAARLKMSTDVDEKNALKQVTKLFNIETAAKKAVKDQQDNIDTLVFEQYEKLDEAAIKTLLVEDKWLAHLQSAIVSEVERMTQQLANRVQLLETRYSQPLPELTQQVSELSDKVAGHLKAMGLEL